MLARCFQHSNRNDGFWLLLACCFLLQLFELSWVACVSALPSFKQTNCSSLPHLPKVWLPSICLDTLWAFSSSFSFSHSLAPFHPLSLSLSGNVLNEMTDIIHLAKIKSARRLQRGQIGPVIKRLVFYFEGSNRGNVFGRFFSQTFISDLEKQKRWIAVITKCKLLLVFMSA